MKEIKKMFEKLTIRIFLLDNEEYWSLSDCCFALGMTNPSHSLKYIPEDYIRTVYVIDAMKRRQEIYVINEAGLYELIFKSRKEEAKKFKKWVFDEVLPSLRKTGHYSIPEHIKAISKEARNALTDEWKAHGIAHPHEYIKLTLKEYSVLGFEKNKRKNDLTKREILRLRALESMEMLKLYDNDDIYGYSDCSYSLEVTSKQINNIIKQELE
jgi:prophage antirepressor-like protein